MASPFFFQLLTSIPVFFLKYRDLVSSLDKYGYPLNEAIESTPKASLVRKSPY